MGARLSWYDEICSPATAHDDSMGPAVALVGWGEEGGDKYWILRNSWGSDWGDDGYFYWRRGAGGVESDVVSYEPDLEGIAAATNGFRDLTPASGVW
mmetsp:Transcript_2343/g.5618  ORF Transcript_2343/g.5618 Transcript_2343/m.5618 type:complete len:97 (+) Transcript_2343:346-636(+)